MYSVSISVAFRNCLSFVAMNSEPLSLRRCPGTPRDRIASARRSRTRSPDIERFTSSSRHSRVNSSTSVSQRSGRSR